MKTRLSHLWENLTSGYWFIPATMLLLASAIAFLMLSIDRNWTAPTHSAWIYTGGPSGARSLLSTVAGSIITVAGVVFSITIATLVQASSQFGPRLLRNFMRDKGNQFVLGTFVATFIYCLLILRSVRGTDDASFVPNLSITLAVLLAVGSIMVLIYFIDHISRSLQGPQVVAAVGRELQRAIHRPFEKQVDREHGEGSRSQQSVPAGDQAELGTVSGCKNGYLQAVDEDGLVEFASRRGIVFRLTCRPGDFVNVGSVLLRFEQSADSVQEPPAISHLFLVGNQRTAEQDLAYSIRQLVEIGVRALSPGINDPFTAMNCIDWLGAAVCAVAHRGLRSPYRYDSGGTCRLVTRELTFSDIVDSAFNQLRQFGSGSVSVAVRLLEVFAIIAPHLRTPQERAIVAHQAEMVHRQNLLEIQEPNDLAVLNRLYDLAMRQLVRDEPSHGLASQAS